MQLSDDAGVKQERDLHGDGKRLAVQRERRRVVDIVCAGGFAFDSVDDVLLRLELHQRRAIVLTQLTERRAHVANELGIELVASLVSARWAAAEQLLLCAQLLMDL